MPEVRLIDANALLKKCIEGDGDNKFTEGYNFAVQEISAYITLAPAIEAEPVRHGRWIDVPDDNTKIAKCSLCGFWQRTSGYDKTGKHLIHKAVYRYCAGCGARMDGGADNG
jgi:Pyruvate/2-oxoacid:ferredoxin oxidoreductase delta subunit